LIRKERCRKGNLGEVELRRKGQHEARSEMTPVSSFSSFRDHKTKERGRTHAEFKGG